MEFTKCPEMSGDFILRQHTNYSDDILIRDGSLTVESNGAFLSRVTFIDSQKPVVIENHGFIYELLMLNGGELFLKGDSIRIVELVTEDELTIHIPRSCSDWKKYFETVNDCLITIVRDQDD